MTTRTMNPPPTPVENAVEAITAALPEMLANAYNEFNVHTQIKDEEQFRSIVAGYFERQTLREWCEHLGIELPETDRER